MGFIRAMISPNRDFLTLNSKILEILISLIFSSILFFRKIIFRRTLGCKEINGQAFLLHFRKNENFIYIIPCRAGSKRIINKILNLFSIVIEISLNSILSAG